MVDYVLNHLPKIFVGENVTELDRDVIMDNEMEESAYNNLKYLEHVIRNAGYFVQSKMVNSKRLGAGQRRLRVYIVAIRIVGTLMNLPKTVQSHLRYIHETCWQTMEIPSRSLESFLMDDHCNLCEWAGSRDRRKEKEDQLWHDDHRVEWLGLGFKSWPSDTSLPESVQQYLNEHRCGIADELTKRCRDLLRLHLMRVQEKLGDMLQYLDEHSIDLSKSLRFSHGFEFGQAATLSTNSSVWLLKRGRLMIPEEKFKLQDFDLAAHGIHLTVARSGQYFKSLPEGNVWRVTDLSVMVGESYHGTSLAAVLITAFAMSGNLMQQGVE